MLSTPRTYLFIVSDGGQSQQLQRKKCQDIVQARVRQAMSRNKDFVDCIYQLEELHRCYLSFAPQISDCGGTGLIGSVSIPFPRTLEDTQPKIERSCHQSSHVLSEQLHGGGEFLSDLWVCTEKLYQRVGGRSDRKTGCQPLGRSGNANG